jgi:hypothetical protein
MVYVHMRAVITWCLMNAYNKHGPLKKRWKKYNSPALTNP